MRPFLCPSHYSTSSVITNFHLSFLLLRLLLLGPLLLLIPSSISLILESRNNDTKYSPTATEDKMLLFYRSCERNPPQLEELFIIIIISLVLPLTPVSLSGFLSQFNSQLSATRHILLTLTRHLEILLRRTDYLELVWLLLLASPACRQRREPSRTASQSDFGPRRENTSSVSVPPERSVLFRLSIVSRGALCVQNVEERCAPLHQCYGRDVRIPRHRRRRFYYTNQVEVPWKFSINYLPVVISFMFHGYPVSSSRYIFFYFWFFHGPINLINVHSLALVCALWESQ